MANHLSIVIGHPKWQGRGLDLIGGIFDPCGGGQAACDVRSRPRWYDPALWYHLGALHKAFN